MRDKPGGPPRGGPKSWRPQLTAQERRAGWVFFALYLFVFPFLVGGAVRVLDERLELLLTPGQSSAIYYALVLLLLTAVFWEFLRHAGRILRDNLRENLFAFCGGFVAGLVLTALFGLLPLPVVSPVAADYKEQFALSPAPVVLVVAVLRPAVEEILYRGLLFGSLRKWNRWAAYALSTLVFALGAVWQFAFPYGGAAYLLLFVQYLPLGAALAWSYDVGGSVFTPMVLRMVLNGLFLLFALVA